MQNEVKPLSVEEIAELRLLAEKCCDIGMGSARMRWVATIDARDAEIAKQRARFKADRDGLRLECQVLRANVERLTQEREDERKQLYAMRIECAEYRRHLRDANVEGQRLNDQLEAVDQVLEDADPELLKHPEIADCVRALVIQRDEAVNKTARECMEICERHAAGPPLDTLWRETCLWIRGDIWRRWPKALQDKRNRNDLY